MNMCMILDGKGNVLALDKVNDSYTGTTFPGGHVERNELFSKSMIREVWEETGLTSSEEGKVYWIPVEELKSKELATGMEYVLQIMESEQIGECYMHLEANGFVGDLY